ncbi:FAD-dependent oxidoreductase [Ramlibacter terrae]|uniref:FAD-dependent oxidoreductase n=1 Tax=Ramlibacter terrae TaxID=2732511 RepID=A0ABX6P711_9BURK|nr:FAD-dependent oxidoreductase [Ramlibacter terrae]
MAEDPSIALHRVAGSQFRYELSGLRTGSIRDQILRAQQLVVALRKAGKISESSRLLVLGGGAAGVSAALTACKQGVHTVIVERRPTPFHTQLNATSRIADPVEFDWPQPHWRMGRIDWDQQVYPLPYSVKMRICSRFDGRSSFRFSSSTGRCRRQSISCTVLMRARSNVATRSAGCG